MAPSTKTSARLAWIIWALATAVVLGAAILVATNRSSVGGTGRVVALTTIGLLWFAGFAGVGAIILSRRPDNAIGWILCVVGVGFAVEALVEEYALHGLLTTPGSFPDALFAGWLQNWLGYIAWWALILLVLLFPDGRLPSRRWRPLVWAIAAAAGLQIVSSILGAHRLVSWLQLIEFDLANPTALGGVAGRVMYDISAAAYFLWVALLVLACVACSRRFRASSGDERLQLKWFAYAGAIVAVTGTITVTADTFQLLGYWVNYLIAAGFIALSAAMAVAILKYRLYDIDLVINKTIVYAALAAFITAVYVAVVVGIGALFRGLSGNGHEPNVGLSILATAIVAVAFQPMRLRVQHLANRLVYGDRATPYEVLSEFSERMGGTFAVDELLPRMAQSLAVGTGSARADVWLREAGVLRQAASWPNNPSRPTPLPMDGDELPQIPGADCVVPVRHRNEVLGALSLTKRSGEGLTPLEAKLTSDLASQAGLVLRNVRLFEDLRASRKRLVTAQDEERRRLERNIHDGAQQQLVALAVKANLAESLVGRDEEKERAMLVQLKAEATDALENLRDLARGIYPPLLADKGLVAALESQAGKSPIPVAIESDGIGRYPQEMEAAVYFCCLEALQNVAKYAQASSAGISLSVEDGSIKFRVADDGVGFDTASTGYGTGVQGMADRLEALGGSLSVQSSVGGGTTVSGTAPIR